MSANNKIAIGNILPYLKYNYITLMIRSLLFESYTVNYYNSYYFGSTDAS